MENWWGNHAVCVEEEMRKRRTVPPTSPRCNLGRPFLYLCNKIIKGWLRLKRALSLLDHYNLCSHTWTSGPSPKKLPLFRGHPLPKRGRFAPFPTSPP